MTEGSARGSLCMMRMVLTLAAVSALALAASAAVSASEQTRSSFISGGSSAVLDDAVLFSARVGAHGTTLWRSDGTKRGTRAGPSRAGPVPGPFSRFARCQSPSAGRSRVWS